VALHGGTYTSAYFDVPDFSLLDLAEATGFTAVSLDRPGYGGSDPLDDDTPFLAGSATVLDDAIAGLWADRSADHPGIVIVSHSIGSAIAVHMAAGKPGWPLLGIALHGVNDRSPDPVVNAWNAMPAGQPVVFTQEQRRMFMYGPTARWTPTRWRGPRSRPRPRRWPSCSRSSGGGRRRRRSSPQG
jgi:pimeloyl-ACP methyl ester carboxylesterase